MTTTLNLMARVVRHDRNTLLDAVSEALQSPLNQATIRDLLILREEVAQTAHLLHVLLPPDLMGKIAPSSAAAPAETLATN